ncbi:MAG: hypothetical protein ABEJ89_08200 [Haloarculaceae archaeon]
MARDTTAAGASRRDLMKALGLGTALTAFGGSAAARTDGRFRQQGDDGSTGEDGGMDGEDGSGDSVHTILTEIEPSTNPDRPADFHYDPTGLAIDPGDVLRFRFVAPDHNVVSYHPAFGMRRRVPTGVGPIASPIKGWDPDTIGPDQIDPPGEGNAGGDGGAGSGNGTGSGGNTGSGDSNGGGATKTAQQAGAPEPAPDTWLLELDRPGVYDFLCSPHETFGMALRVVVGNVTEAPFETSDPNALPEPRVGPVGLARVTLTDPALSPSNVLDQGTVSWDDLAANGGGGTPTETETPTPTGTETETPTETP